MPQPQATTDPTQPAGTDPTIELALHMFRQSLDHVRQMVHDVPEERLLDTPAGLRNHPLWTLAHLGVACDFLLQIMGQGPGPDAEQMKHFGPGSEPGAARPTGMTKATLLAQLQQAHERIEPAVRAGHRQRFPQPAPEHLRSFAPTLGHIGLYLLTAHEPYHTGQLAQWRRAAGLSRL